MNSTIDNEEWAFKKPFRITGHTFDGVDVLVVTVEENGHIGRGEASGVYYRGETAKTMAEQVKRVAGANPHLTRIALAGLLSAGGARNALDCALWDLESKRSGR